VPSVERKLAAIFASDIAGYSRLRFRSTSSPEVVR
jgi:hypothetical protein